MGRLDGKIAFHQRYGSRKGGTITAPDGHSLTLTVDGVETVQLLTETGGTATLIQAGTYRGDVVLTVAEANDVTYETLTFPFRQALYVDADGVVRDKSVLAAVLGGRLTDALARNISITSTGECFDGVYVQDGTYTLQRPVISLTGNGRCDFAGSTRRCSRRPGAPCRSRAAAGCS
ncbi:hypothetical protein [Streptomyces sp. NPDC048581]|uniref:hypothetical protein n=1 Tax=unclassified Streptomyces TaxID=2593676 RepID=UPI00371EE4D2